MSMMQVFVFHYVCAVTFAWTAVGLPTVPLHRNCSPQGSGRYPVCAGYRRRSCINVAWLVSSVWYGWPRYFVTTPTAV